MIKKDNRSK